MAEFHNRAACDFWPWQPLMSLLCDSTWGMHGQCVMAWPCIETGQAMPLAIDVSIDVHQAMPLAIDVE